MKIRALNSKDRQKNSQLFYKLHPEIKKRKLLSINKFKAENKMFLAEENNEIVSFI